MDKESRTSERNERFERFERPERIEKIERMSVPAPKDSTYIERIVLDNTPVATIEDGESDVPMV